MEQAITTPWGPVGYVTYKRTYSRKMPNGTQEEFPDTIERVIQACRDQLHVGFTTDEEDRFRRHLLGLRGFVAGRFMWQLGTTTVDRLGLLSLQNCAFTVVDDPVRPFTWTMDALMLGAGVGFNIQREYVDKLPPVHAAKVTRLDPRQPGKGWARKTLRWAQNKFRPRHADFVVPDSREGWVELLQRTLEAHFITGESFTYSTHLIRKKGEPIRGFGGIAAGPAELCWGIAEISRILNERAGQKVRPIDCLDMMNIIGFVVVSGNVRRAAEIALGDPDDMEFLRAKRWDLGTIPKWRAMSNNTVVADDYSVLPDEFWDGYRGKGEPYGLLNLRLAREIGRLGDARFREPKIKGVNPCGEQPMEDKETCCLAEIPLPMIRSYAELLEVVTLLYRVCKHSLALPCHAEETAEVVHRNTRMGIGITGYCQATAEQKSWLAPAYEALREYDVVYSAAHGWEPSVKLTTCKPGGTLSLLPGVTPGASRGIFQHFIRRIRMASNIPLVDQCARAGYDIEPQRNLDGTLDYNTMVVNFPCSYPPGTALAKDATAIDQLETVRDIQRDWSDNAVSCTIYYRAEELLEIQGWLRANYRDSIKSVSFLLHQGHGFVQAPYEEITEEQFHEMSARVRPIDYATVSMDDLDLQECAGGACSVR